MVAAAQTVLTSFEPLLGQLTALCRAHYRERLISLAVFGSVGRGTPRIDSDIDFLVVARDLPDGRLRRVAEFQPVEAQMTSVLTKLSRSGLHTELSPVFKTPEEIQTGSPLLLDMAEDALILYDRDDFLKQALQDLKSRLEKLGARRIWQGNAWYWDLKPDYHIGEIFQI